MARAPGVVYVYMYRKEWLVIKEKLLTGEECVMVHAPAMGRGMNHYAASVA